MTKLVRYIIPLILIIIIQSCATYVPVKVLKPAKVDIGPVKKIAVLDFEFTGSWDFDEEEEPETLGEIAKEALKKSLGLDEQASPPPGPLTAYPGEKISSKFIAKLVENGHYSVIERDQLSKLLAEQELSMSGIIDENQATQIGKLIGVEALIFGSGFYSVVDDGGWYEFTGEDEDGDEYTYYMYKIFRKVDAELTYRVVNVSTGEIIASKTNSSSNYDEGKLFFPYDDYSEHEDEEIARKNLPEWKPIVNRLTNKIIKKSIKQIAPYYVKQEREIKSGKSPAMKAGLEYAKRQIWEDAKQSWETVLESNSSLAVKDHVSAMYNIGIYYEINGDLDRAEELFDKCFKQSGDSSYLDARKRIQKRKKELIRLKEQQGD